MPSKKQVEEAKDNSHGWMDIIHDIGERGRKEREEARQTKLKFMRDYFQDGHIRLMEEDDVILVWEENDHPVLNQMYAGKVLADNRILEDIWEEISHRRTFDALLLEKFK